MFFKTLIQNPLSRGEHQPNRGPDEVESGIQRKAEAKLPLLCQPVRAIPAAPGMEPAVLVIRINTSAWRGATSRWLKTKPSLTRARMRRASTA